MASNRSKKLTFLVTVLLCITVTYFSQWSSEDLLSDAIQSEPGVICSCNDSPTVRRPDVVYGVKSLCQSPMADRGPHQRVVSYSLEGDVNNAEVFERYVQYLGKIATQIAHIYPGWVMRIYHRYGATDAGFTDHLCPVYCRFNHVDLCNVDDLGSTSSSVVPENLEKVFSLMWRFLPMADPTVDVFLSRDLDSAITEREAAAVNYWLHSTNTTLHAMADHPSHNAVIMGGMWGARMQYREKRALLRTSFLEMKEKAGLRKKRDWDQQMLRLLRSAVGESDIVRHDAYRCEVFENSHPFPTQRVGYDFIGLPLYNENGPLPKCPAACRPREHQDWEYC